MRAGLAVLLFYRFLVLQPLALLRFAWGWNTLWYGRLIGALLTLYLPFLPVLFFGLVIYTRLNEALNPFVKVDWKMAGPGRVFFVRPDSFFASLMWDFYLSISVFSGSFLQYGTDKDGLEEMYRERSLLKRSVLPEDIAEGCYFFASEQSAKSTGNILNVDAGNVQAFTR